MLCSRQYCGAHDVIHFLKLHGDKIVGALSFKLVNPLSLSWLTHLTSTVYIGQIQPIHILICYK